MESFITPSRNTGTIYKGWTTATAAASFDDFEDFSNDFSSSSSSSSSSSNNSNHNSSDEDIFASLRKRQDYLSSFGSLTSSSSSSSSSSTTGVGFGATTGGRPKSEEEIEIMTNWRNAECTSTMRPSLDDWVRRLAIDTFPLGVCGSANGSIYLIDLDRGETLDCVPNIHDAQTSMDDEEVEDSMRNMFGKFDGGGVLSIGIHNDIVVSSGREGGLQVFKIDGEETSYYKGSRGGSSTSTKLHLKSEGMLHYLLSTLVTSVAFDDGGMLWVGANDGFIRAFEYDDREKTLIRQSEPVFEMDADSEVLSISVNNEIGCGVAATASGEVILFSLEEGEVMVRWKPFGKGVGKRKREFARSALIVQNNEANNANEAVWSIIAGGSEGSMFQRRLNVDSIGYVSDRNPLMDDEALIGRFRPSHTMSVVSLSSPFPGLVVSGSQDGHIRIWDCAYHRSNEGVAVPVGEEDEEEAQFDDISSIDKRPRCLYALTGFKVWLGSIFTDGKKLVSDGADNSIVVHDFSGEDDSAEGFLFEDDDLEDFLDFD